MDWFDGEWVKIWVCSDLGVLVKKAHFYLFFVRKRVLGKRVG